MLNSAVSQKDNWNDLTGKRTHQKYLSLCLTMVLCCYNDDYTDVIFFFFWNNFRLVEKLQPLTY